MKIAILASALALTLVRPALADPWLFYDFTERTGFVIPDQPTEQATTNFGGAYPYLYTSPADVYSGGNWHSDQVSFFFYGGDTWGIDYANNATLGTIPPNFPDQTTWYGYALNNGTVTPGYFQVQDDHPIPWDTAIPQYGYHTTDLTVCDANTAGCSIAAIDAAPEPSAWALMLAGVAMIGIMLRFGRRRTASAMA